MTIDELNQYVSGLKEELLEGVSDIFAKTDLEIIFTLKKYDRNPWKVLKYPKKKGR